MKGNQTAGAGEKPGGNSPPGGRWSLVIGHWALGIRSWALGIPGWSFSTGAWWRYGRAMIVPGLIWLMLLAVVFGPLRNRTGGQDRYDQAALREWIEEARLPNKTLAGLIDDYFEAVTELSE